MPQAQRRQLFQRGTEMQPVRTMPEQDETGRGDSGPTSTTPIDRQRMAMLRSTRPVDVAEVEDQAQLEGGDPLTTILRLLGAK